MPMFPNLLRVYLLVSAILLQVISNAFIVLTKPIHLLLAEPVAAKQAKVAPP